MDEDKLGMKVKTDRHMEGKKRLTWIGNVCREETRKRGSVRARPVSSINSETIIPQKLEVV